MKRLIQLTFVLFLTLGLVSVAQAQQFITIWNTGSSNSINVPALGDYTFYWEDTTNTTINDIGSGSDDINITFPSSGVYKLYIIKSGSNPFNKITLGGAADAVKLVEIKQWGNIEWSDWESIFEGASNLKISATDIPNLDNVSSFEKAFMACTSLDTIPNVSLWDVSKVTNMKQTFQNATSFNGDIGDWNVSQVTTMFGMFRNAPSFNQNIGSWTVSSVQDMGEMFYLDYYFNQDISLWDVSQVANMSKMFYNVQGFDQNIGNWDVGNVEDMSNMFFQCYYFNQDLNWDVRRVKNMSSMFKYASTFDGDISSWQTDSVTNMSEMFQGCFNFNQDISSWNVEQVTNMSNMFYNAKKFNQNIDSWDVGQVINMSNMFYYAIEFNQNIDSWDVGQVNNMSNMFFGASKYNQNMNSWDISNVTNMAYMFCNAKQFNQDLSGWDMKNVVNMTKMLEGDSAFNQNLGKWELNSMACEFSFIGTSMTCENYSLSIAGWAMNPDVKDTTNLITATDLSFSMDILSYRAILTGKNWSFSGDALGSCSVDPDVVFSIQLIDFDARAVQNQSLLSWTATTNNLKGFGIERSADGQNWEQVAYLANYTTETTADFRFIDEQTLAGKNFYRLKIENNHGEFNYSEIKLVQFDNNQPITVYPNPAQDIINISGLNGSETIELFDITGRSIQRLQAKDVQTTVSLQSLQAGVYHLIITAPNGTKQTQNIVKQ